ncbi:MoaD/ThiS family protein [bacterium]|nr:MoaD/ThiS family protein [bacterium]NUN45311.1 MoaD/ThiS family protein [bacterium]
MVIHIPNPLRSYTSDEKVQAEGHTIAEVLKNLDAQFPGIRFRVIDEQDRIRRHIKIFLNEEMVDNLKEPIESKDTLHIICALSGG